MERDTTYTAFVGTTLLGSGQLHEVLPLVKSRFDQDQGTLILIFEDQTGRQVDFDLRGKLAEVLTRALPEKVRTGPGRPRLGVVAREVSLLPRHWEWLEQQSSGASAALRRLVDEARKENPDEQRVRSTIEAADRFLSAMAGNLPGYEEATRALYGRNRERLNELVRDWPRDIRSHFQHLVRDAF
jgi:uncharacterized protein